MQGLLRELNKTFFQTLEDIKTKEDLEIFINDFLSKNELGVLIKRLGIAYWLKKGRDYKNIKTNLQVTTSEIKQVETKLNSKGYKLALKKMEAEDWANVWSEKIKKVI